MRGAPRWTIRESRRRGAGFANGVGDPERQRQRRPALFTSNHHLPLAPNSMDKALQLEPQRVGLRRLQHDPLDDVGQLPAGPRLPAGPYPHELAAAAGQVEREVAVGLEQPEATDPLSRHPGRRGQCHGAVGELDPRVGDIQVGGEHRQTRRPHLGGRAAGEMQHQVQIVDHEIEHHGDVGAAGLERGQAVALDVAGSVEIGLGRAERPVEPLDVADLQLDLLPLRRRDEAVRLGEGRRQRLLHQDRAPAPAPESRPLQCAGVGTATVTASTSRNSASRSS